MENQIRKYNIIAAILVFVGIPVLIYALGDFPRRSLLKESISLLTILSFSLLIAQFFLARSNKKMLKSNKMIRVIKIHKIIGYIFVSVILVHPILIVLPRYFEGGINPVEAFTIMLTTTDSTGVLLGITSWVLLLILGLTSFFRNKLAMKYKTWRMFHGILSMIFISTATWHAIDLGCHTTLPISVFLLILATSGIILLFITYFFKNKVII